ncbi:MAG: leucine-rich repeat protein [Clostridia bacterium]|nr:leucine-rich repeat protein [Clostridia bacterium]
MKKRKSIIGWLLVLLLVISSIIAMPLSVSGAGNGPVIEEGDYRAVCYEDGTAMLIEAKVNEEHITVPSEIGGYKITEISGAYKDNNKIKSVTIPDTVTGILGRAFENCKNLESVTMTDSVTLIAGSAFKMCGKIKSIDVSDNLTKIGDEAFLECHALTEVTIPENVVEIGSGAFAYCKNLATVNINKNPDLVIDGSAFNGTKWYKSQPNGVVYLDRFALNYKGNMSEGLKVDFKDGTTAICNDMFYDSEFDDEVTALAGVTFPDTLTYIGGNVFKKCVNLEKVVFPESLTYIGSGAFEGCTALKSVVIPAGVKDLRHGFSRSGLESVTLQGNPDMWYYAFYECENLKEVNLAEGVEDIHTYAFYGCKALESVTLPNSVKTIEGAAFKNCENLKGINHSGEIYIVGSDSFDNTAWEKAQPEGFVYFGDVILYYNGEEASSIEELIIEDGIKGVADGAFANYKNLKKVVFPEGFKAIGAYSFRSAKVESIVIPESVEFIGYSAFSGCIDLSYLEVNGGGVIEYHAFVDCINLKSVTISADFNEIGDDAFGKYYTMDGKVLVEDFVINGYEGSEAENYAKKNDIKFVSLGVVTESTETTEATEPVESEATATTTTVTTDNVTEPTEPSTGGETEPTETSTPDETESTEPSTPDETKPSEPAEDKDVLGDVNSDGKVNVKDATLIQKAAAKITKLDEAENMRADVNGDSKVNVKDATAIQKFAAKIETGFPVGKPIGG